MSPAHCPIGHERGSAMRENIAALWGDTRKNKGFALQNLGAKLNEGDVVRPAGIEPAAPGFGGQYSIH